MNVPDLGTVIVERYFEAKDEAGDEKEVILRIGMPVRSSQPGEDWCCPYQIDGIEESRVRVAFGIDSLQAFLLALEKAKAELGYIQRVSHLRVTWLEQDEWGMP
jgi:hypothetical protein